MSEIGYIIDCSFELLESTPDVYESLDFSLFRYGYDIEKRFYNNPNTDTLEIMNSVSKDIDLLRQKHFSKMENDIVSLKSLSCFPSQYQIFKESLLDKMIESHMLTRYNMEKPRLFIFSDSDETRLPIVQNEDDIFHPFNIYECIQSNPNLFQWHQRVTEKTFCDFQRLLNMDVKESVLEYIDYNENKLNNFQAKTLEVINFEKKTPKHKKKQTRNALKRAINLFSSFFGEDKIKAFLNGNSFSVEGKYFNYIIKKSNTSIIKHTENPFAGHIPYSLEIADKESNVIFGNLCITIEKTPVIDQIIAILFHLKTNEEEVLKKANLFQVRMPFKEINNQYVHEFFHHQSITNTNIPDMTNQKLKDYNTFKDKIKSKNKNEFHNIIDKLFRNDLGFPNNLINHFNKPVFYFDEIMENTLYQETVKEQHFLNQLLET